MQPRLILPVLAVLLASVSAHADEADDEASPVWTTLTPHSLVSSGGATLTRKPDGSILASGKNTTGDSYVFKAHTTLKGITAIRLEALPDPSLPRQGPGRADNAN